MTSGRVLGNLRLHMTNYEQKSLNDQQLLEIILETRIPLSRAETSEAVFDFQKLGTAQNRLADSAYLDFCNSWDARGPYLVVDLLDLVDISQPILRDTAGATGKKQSEEQSEVYPQHDFNSKFDAGHEPSANSKTLFKVLLSDGNKLLVGFEYEPVGFIREISLLQGMLRKPGEILARCFIRRKPTVLKNHLLLTEQNFALLHSSSYEQLKGQELIPNKNSRAASQGASKIHTIAKESFNREISPEMGASNLLNKSQLTIFEEDCPLDTRLTQFDDLLDLSVNGDEPQEFVDVRDPELAASHEAGRENTRFTQKVVVNSNIKNIAVFYGMSLTLFPVDCNSAPALRREAETEFPRSLHEPKFRDLFLTRCLCIVDGSSRLLNLICLSFKRDAVGQRPGLARGLQEACALRDSLERNTGFFRVLLYLQQNEQYEKNQSFLFVEPFTDSAVVTDTAGKQRAFQVHGELLCWSRTSQNLESIQYDKPVTRVMNHCGPLKEMGKGIPAFIP